MNKIILSIALAAICFTAAGLGALVARPAEAPTKLSGIDTPIYAYTNATSTTVSTVSQQIVATSSSRRYLLLQNAGPSTVYCNVNGKAAVDQLGFFITASSSRAYEGSSLYTGAIACIASTSVKMFGIEAF